MVNMPMILLSCPLTTTDQRTRTRSPCVAKNTSIKTTKAIIIVDITASITARHSQTQTIKTINLCRCKVTAASTTVTQITT